MAKKKVRNKFRNALGDYYKTNREIARDESKREGFRGPMTSRDKAMIIVVVLLVLVLIVKSCFFDEVKNLTPAEAQFKNFVEYTLSTSDELNGKMEKSGFVMYRVYDIFKAKEGQQVQLKYVDEETGKKVEKIQNDRYTARVRGYLLGVIPVKHFAITAPESGGSKEKEMEKNE